MNMYAALFTLLFTFLGLQANAQVGENFCARENEYCQVNGIGDVYYGANGRFAVQYNVRGGIMCNNQNFGDPSKGDKKACYIDYSGRGGPGRGPGRGPDRGPGRGPDRDRGTWKYCAREDQTCYIPERFPVEVRFGVPGRWDVQRAQGSIPCSRGAFRDPAKGVKKYCEYYSRF